MRPSSACGAPFAGSACGAPSSALLRASSWAGEVYKVYLSVYLQYAARLGAWARFVVLYIGTGVLTSGAAWGAGLENWMLSSKRVPRCRSQQYSIHTHTYVYLRNLGQAGPFLPSGHPQVLIRTPRHSRRAGPFLRPGPPQVLSRPPGLPRGFSWVPRRRRQDSKHPRLTNKPPRQAKVAPRRFQKPIICQRNPQRGPVDLKIVKKNNGV